MRYAQLVALTAILGLLTASVPALAQSPAGLPSGRPIVVIAPYEPGGPVDIEGRMYSKKAIELTSQQFIIEYKSGAATRIGVGFVAKAPADGHTLLITNASFTIFPVMYKNLPFDTIRDFAPVSRMSTKTNVFLAQPAFPARNFVEYLAYAKANPGKVNYGMLGSGSTGHLVGAWIETASNSRVTYIPYKGTGPLLLDLAAGRVDVSSAALIAALPYVKSGKLRALAVMTESRAKVLPDLPTIAEQGIPGFTYLNWTGFFAPRGTPAATVNWLSDVFARVARAPDIISTAETHGNIMVGSTPARFAQLILEETVRWQKLADDKGIKLEE